MSEFYPYCSKCDKELSKKERKMNEEVENVFYPVCEECLQSHATKLNEIAEEIKGENG